MSLTTLISTDALCERLADPSTVIVDCRVDLRDATWGRRAYLERHIPGAVFVDLDRDLSAPRTGRNGRHPLPAPETLAEVFGRLGIDDSVQVAAYDQGGGMFAARLWWSLRWLGHERVAVLDGGFARWEAQGRPVRSGEEVRRPRTFRPHVQQGWTADADEVARAIRSGASVLVDARAPARYRGDEETLDPVAGHIPGAVNYFFERSLTARETFRPAAELRAALTEVLGGASADRVICYCGSGVTACHTILAMEIAGLPGARLYPGSWSEWCSDPARPIATGNESMPRGTA